MFRPNSTYYEYGEERSCLTCLLAKKNGCVFHATRDHSILWLDNGKCGCGSWQGDHPPIPVGTLAEAVNQALKPFAAKGCPYTWDAVVEGTVGTIQALYAGTHRLTILKLIFALLEDTQRPLLTTEDLEKLTNEIQTFNTLAI